jgi:two-component system, cell cycle sensor histidine kinase and response regulator CckA
LEKTAKILVVDDEPVVQLLLEEVLAQDGHAVTIAGDAAAASAALDSLGEIDVALVDKNLPDRSGLEVIRQVKERQPDAEVIMITGYPSLDSAIEAMRVGAFDYLVKPFGDINDLRVKVRNACEKRWLIRSEREKQVLERQLVQAQKMEAVGRLAGGIAHDFNNLLVVIQGSAQFIKHVVERDPERAAEVVAKYVDSILDASASASSMTRQLLAFSRRQVVAPEVLDLNAAVRSTERLVSRLAGESVEVFYQLTEDPWPVEIDRTHIDQLIVNVVVNARDAMPAGGKLTFATRNLELDDGEVGPLLAGSYLELSIADTGTGMSDEVRQHAFEPFFTTKNEAAGTGLGLPTVQSITEQAGGEVTLDSTPGRGTIVRVYLPASSSSPSATFRVPGPPARGQGEVILLVEDDAPVRSVMRQMLEDAGYEVIEAEAGPAGIELFKSRAGEVALVVTDVVMPGMSGKQLVDQLSALRPGLPALYTSGYAADVVIQHGVSGEDVTLVPKPFDEPTLLRAVRTVLDR